MSTRWFQTIGHQEATLHWAVDADNLHNGQWLLVIETLSCTLSWSIISFSHQWHLGQREQFLPTNHVIKRMVCIKNILVDLSYCLFLFVFFFCFKLPNLACPSFQGFNEYFGIPYSDGEKFLKWSPLTACNKAYTHCVVCYLENMSGMVIVSWPHSNWLTVIQVIWKICQVWS